MNKELLPNSMDDAIRVESWSVAIKMEYNSLFENEVGELLNRGSPKVAAGTSRLSLLLVGR